MRVRVQEQHRELALLRFDERGLVRGLVIGLEREPLQWQERLLLPALLRRLLQVPEQGPLKGQALAQLSGRRPRRRSDKAISDE